MERFASMYEERIKAARASALETPHTAPSGRQAPAKAKA
jgi:hypothetical protein